MPLLIKKIIAVCAGASALINMTAIPKVNADSESSIVINEICAKNTTYAAPDGKYYDPWKRKITHIL